MNQKQPEQQTLERAVSAEGIGLHTGKPATLRFIPAPPNHGIRFRRTDLDDAPEVPADLEHVTSTDRCTTLGAGPAQVQTVEHLLAALSALELDNLLIEIDGPEVPIGDGSFRFFSEILSSAGRAGQATPAKVLELDRVLQTSGPGGASYVALPATGLRISATLEFDHPLLKNQFASFRLTPDVFRDEIAPARTFGFAEEADDLRKRGLALGASPENAVILDSAGVVDGELRYPDEFVRHKIGDVLGDLALLGQRVQGHFLVERPSHRGNLDLAKELKQAGKSSPQPIVDIQKIMQYLPHRYPMLLVDRIIGFEAKQRITGIKNVTINEPFFQGHYPGHPIMPGVLIIEAMAQVGGLLLMDAIENPQEKVVYFMSLDNVKWRRPVTPGDQIRFELELLQLRRHVARMRGTGHVDGNVVAEAEMMARIVDR